MNDDDCFVWAQQKMHRKARRWKMRFFYIPTNTVFGWSENREDGKHREENRVENSVFYCLAKERKWGGRKTREKVFSPGPTIFILPNREENLERKVL